MTAHYRPKILPLPVTMARFVQSRHEPYECMYRLGRALDVAVCAVCAVAAIRVKPSPKVSRLRFLCYLTFGSPK